MRENEQFIISVLKNVSENKEEKLPIPEGVDANEVWEILRAHKVEVALNKYIAWDRPKRLFCKLRRESNEKAYKSMFSEMERIFRNLDEANILYAVNKGLYTAILSYEQVGDRWFNDIDILIDASDEGKTVSILKSNGFSQSKFDKEAKELTAISRQSEVFFSAFTHQTAPFIKVVDSLYAEYMTVDVNHHIMWGEVLDEYKDFDMKDLISHRRMMNFCGVRFWGLEPEYGFIHMALHLYNDLNSMIILTTPKGYNLRGFLDIYLFVKNNNLNWKLIRDYCFTHRIANYVYYVLRMTGVVFSDPFLQTYMEPVDGYDKSMEETFGLTPEELKTWHHGIWDRIFSKDKQELMGEYLTERDWKKVVINHNYL